MLTCDVVRVFDGCGQWWGTRTPGTAGGHGGHESRDHQSGYVRGWKQKLLAILKDNKFSLRTCT